MDEQALAGDDAPTAAPDPDFDWRRIAYLTLVSRAMDRLEEERLVPERKILYQFSARGHDMAQVLLGSLLTHRRDAACGYYRSRPLLLALGVPPVEALGSNMGRAGGYSDGRDIGVVFNYPNPNGCPALPMCGGVGAQYTPTAGWAQAITYHRDVLGDQVSRRARGGARGDASCATHGFWSALTMARRASCRCSLCRGQYTASLSPPPIRRRAVTLRRTWRASPISTSGPATVPIPSRLPGY